MTNKEEEQLLQDASTLLMFANVAAKQQNQTNIRQVSPPAPVTYPQQPPQQQQQQQLPQPQPHRSPMEAYAQPVSTSAHYQPQQPIRQSILESPPTQHNQYPRPQYAFPAMYSGPRPHPPPPPYGIPQQQQQQQHSPQLQHTQIAQPPILIQPQQNQHTYPQTQEVQQRSRHESTNVEVQARQQPPAPPHRSSISILMNTPEPTTEPQTETKQQQVQPTTTSTLVIPQVQVHPPQLQTFIHTKSKSQSPISQVTNTTTDPIAVSRKSLSPPSKLPKQGNFKPTHERSRSTPDAHVAIKFRHLQVSPPKNKFARGIDLETGERNTTNAVIAAAALTAAADVPLPLKHVEVKRNTTSPPTTKPSTSAPTLATSKAKVVKLEVPTKREDDQLTEPDLEKTDDEEKTEDETATKQPVKPSSPPAEEVENKSSTFKAPPLSSYQVDPDSGLIGCICGIEDDDGFTIQCDVCYRWQHCLCMGFQSAEEVPEDEYKCYYCDEQTWGKFDPELCRLRTLARLNSDRIGSKSQDDYSMGEQEQQQETEPPQPTSVKRRQSGPEKQAEKKKKLEDKKDSTELTPPVKSPSLDQEEKDLSLPNKDNELLEDGITAESYQSVYYKLKQNDYKKQSIKEFIENIGHDFYHRYLILPKTEQQKKSLNNVEIMTFNQFKALKMSKIILPNHRKYLQDHHKLSKKKNFNKSIIQVKPYSDNQKQKFNGISRLSLFISSSNNNTATTTAATATGSGPGESIVIPENTPIIEYLGEIDLFKNYKHDSVNQYTNWGTTKPKVLKTSIPANEGDLNLVLDSRFVGNESRFIRKSCPSSANCRIQPVYIPEKNTFKFMVLTSKPIILKADSHDEELRLPWEWDPEHPISKLYENNYSEKFENLTNIEKSALITYIDNILNFVECGCSTFNNLSTCAIFKIKKATSYLLRSTRKANSISNVNLVKSKDELILPKPSKEYVSWEKRLVNRDLQLQAKILTPEDVSEQSESSEETKNVIDKPSILFKVPFKQQLIDRTRNIPDITSLPTPKPEDIEDEDELDAKDEGSPLDIPFPVVSELVISIDKKIEENLKPIVKEVETKSLQTLVHEQDLLDSKTEVEIIQKVVAATINPVESVQPEIKMNKVAELKEIDEPPKVVKKLSFADYKKKMK
ncbi:SET domain-containing protein 3 [Spathaspora sp. JA1]|nr:SET domain-containing protein 3 [Spathaspora sp. JA1]